MGNYVLLNVNPARIYHTALFKILAQSKFLFLLLGTVSLVMSEFEIME